jgi:hypothetical protein
MKKIILPLLLLSLLTSASWAADLSGQSRTYLQSYDTTDSRVTPLYEYLDFQAQDIGTKALSFHFGGWYRYDLQGESYDTKSTGDLQYAYLSMRASRANTYLNLGRVIVNQGTIFSQFDGASAGTDLRWGFSVNAFGGLPVETDFDTRTGDSVYGGRISQGIEGIYRVGFSYLYEKNDHEDFRKEDGFDLWFRPVSKVELTGTALYNALTHANARDTGVLSLGPFSFLTLRTNYSHVNYGDYFTSPTTSVFSLATPSTPGLDPNEKVTIIGEEAVMTFGKLGVSADYTTFSYKIAGDAHSYGGRITYSLLKNAGAGFSAHRMAGQIDALRYDEYRLYGYDRFAAWDFALDLIATQYDVEINGIKNAYSASLSGGYSITPKARVAADVEYARNPFYNSNVSGLVKFVYNFDYAPAARRK